MALTRLGSERTSKAFKVSHKRSIALGASRIVLQGLSCP
jgi:hypothetical protein